MSVLPSPGRQAVRCGLSSRTTQARPPTCNMLSTTPTLRPNGADSYVPAMMAAGNARTPDHTRDTAHNLPVGADEGYLLANQQTQAGTRLEALATLFDPSTFRH